MSFSLDGTAKAMELVLDCVKTIAPVTEANNESKNVKEKAKPIAQTEATILLANLLNAASITGYKLENPPASAGGSAHYTLATGARGYLIAMRGSSPEFFEEYVDGVLQLESSQCSGDLKSGKQVIQTVDGSLARKLVSVCRGGAENLLSETTVVRRADGFLYSITQIQAAQSALDQPSGTDVGNGGSLTEAALKLEGTK